VGSQNSLVTITRSIGPQRLSYPDWSRFGVGGRENPCARRTLGDQFVGGLDDQRGQLAGLSRSQAVIDETPVNGSRIRRR
jgi:hypothetical protein